MKTDWLEIAFYNPTDPAIEGIKAVLRDHGIKFEASSSDIPKYDMTAGETTGIILTILLGAPSAWASIDYLIRQYCGRGNQAMLKCPVETKFIGPNTDIKDSLEAMLPGDPGRESQPTSQPQSQT